MPTSQAKTLGTDRDEQWRDGSTLVVHRADFTPFPAEYFEPDYWLAKSRAQSIGAGRGAAWLVRSDFGAWVLRHYRRGGAVARLSRDAYVWTGSERSRSVREYRILVHLHGRGLPVPAPVAARVVRTGFVYRADLITVYLDDTRSLGDLLATQDLDAETLRAAGRCVRRFHDARVWHADLNAHNILVGADGGVSLIDFDRARLRTGEGWKSANLARLRRSFDKLSRQRGADAFDGAAWRTLVDAYTDAQ